MSATDTATEYPKLGVLVIEVVPGVHRRLMYRLSAKTEGERRYKSLAIHDGRRTKSLLAEGTLAHLGPGFTSSETCPILQAGDVDIAMFIAHWSDTSLTVDAWLALVRAEPSLNHDEKERLAKLYAAYMRESAR